MVELARRALAERHSLIEMIGALGEGEPVDLSRVTVLAPIDHPDTAHLLMTGTGLTHLGSAEGRDKMHRAID
ncbi:FAH family protein, partial [Acinetobacter baumannii]